MSDITNLSSFVWSIAEILRGDFKRSEYGKVMLPFVVLRRLDCLLQDTKAKVLEAERSLPNDMGDVTRDRILFDAVGGNIKIYNISPFTFDTLKEQEPKQLRRNLIDYISDFSPNVRDIFLDKFRFAEQIKRLQDGGILWSVFDQFCSVDLHPNSVSNLQMGYLFEELIRRFSEMSNETAGEHFTPREVIRLIVDMLIANDYTLKRQGAVRQVYDPACGTGGMLVLTEEALKEHNSSIQVKLFGQELNDEAFGICKSDMLVTGHNPEQIAFGNTLVDDAHADQSFHYMLSNPPYGVDWKKYQAPVQAESKNLGMAGRYGAGLPRVSDGQLLFLQHMISKMRDDDTGSRIGMVTNGSPLFAGGPGTGESAIRRWMMESDLIEAIVALPTDLFYNTGIHTYIWILTNRKAANRRGKVQLIDASRDRFWKSMRKSLGSKRREIPDDAREEIVHIYSEFLNGGSGESDVSKVFETAEFGYREVRVERPLRMSYKVTRQRLASLNGFVPWQRLDKPSKGVIENALQSLDGRRFTSRQSFKQALLAELENTKVVVSKLVMGTILRIVGDQDASADVCLDDKGNPEPDVDLRDHERLPLDVDWRDYFRREVKPHIPEAWVDENHTDEHDKQVGRVGYEINFNRLFFQYQHPRPLEEINNELKILESEIEKLMREVSK